MIVNVRLIELFQSSRNCYPGQAFDSGLNKFFDTAAEKAALAKKIQKKKEEIKEYLGRFFGGKKNIMMTYDSKGRQCIFYQCPVKDCSSKSNQITRHLTGAKHKWTEVGASGYNGKKVSRTWFQ